MKCSYYFNPINASDIFEYFQIDFKFADLLLIGYEHITPDSALALYKNQHRFYVLYLEDYVSSLESVKKSIDTAYHVDVERFVPVNKQDEQSSKPGELDQHSKYHDGNYIFLVEVKPRKDSLNEFLLTETSSSNN